MIFKTKKEYAKCIEYLIDNKNEYEKMKENAYNFSNNFSLATFANKIISVYERVLDDYSSNDNNNKSKKKIFKR